MSALRPYRLERELDSAFYHWLAWLPSWVPAFGRRRYSACDVCPLYIDALGLHEIPHAPLHSLFGAVETLISHQFDREVDALFPDFRGSGEWEVSIAGGEVHIETPEGHSLEAVLAASGLTGGERPLAVVTPERAAQVQIALERTHWALFEISVARLGVQKQLILRAIDAHVEPKVRELADALVAEVCEPF